MLSGESSRSENINEIVKRIVVILEAKIVWWLANGRTDIGKTLRHEIWKTKRFVVRK